MISITKCPQYSGFYKGETEFKRKGTGFYTPALTNRPLKSSARAQYIRVCVERVSGLERRTRRVCTLDKVKRSYLSSVESQGL